MFTSFCRLVCPPPTYFGLAPPLPSCSGITGGVKLGSGALFFNPSPYSAAQIEALRTVMVFTVAVGVVKAINFNYTITLSTCSIYAGFRPTVSCL